MPGYVLGVDIGTTYTGAAIARDGRVEVVALGHHSTVMPSVVFLREDGELLTGDAANRRALQQPDRVAREFKRRMGDPTPLMLAGTPFSPEALTARVLGSVYDQVVELQGEEPDRLVLSHPANWGPYKTDVLAHAVRLAGLDAATMVTEPEAAAWYYASRERLEVGEVMAVYDLGGGTFDVAVVRCTDDGFEMIGTPEGIDRLGGIDIDEAVLAHVRAVLVEEAIARLTDGSDRSLVAAARLRRECVEAKEALSADDEVVIPVVLPDFEEGIRITRDELEASIRPMLSDTIDALRRALDSAEVTPDDLAVVLVVGGSSRLPIVTEMITEQLGRPVAVDAHPKHACALGAALVGDAAWEREHGRAPRPMVLATTEPPVARPTSATTAPERDTRQDGVAPGRPTPPPPPAPSDEPDEPARRRLPWMVGLGLLAVVALIFGIVAISGDGDEGDVGPATTVDRQPETASGPGDTSPTSPTTPTTLTTSPATTVDERRTALEAVEAGTNPGEYTITGTVPPGAAFANVGARINMECDCSALADLVIDEIIFEDASAAGNRVEDGQFQQGVEFWGVTVSGTWTVVESPTGTGRAVSVVADRQPFFLNSPEFPVRPGDTFTARFRAVIGERTEESGYFAVFFLGPQDDVGDREIERLEFAIE